MADRVSADKKYVELAQDKLKAKNVLGFKDDDSTGTAIYMFAVALGVDAGYQTASARKEGLAQASAVSSYSAFPAMSFIYSIALQELIKEGKENDINNTDIVFGIVEGYANTGFKIIEEMIPDFNKYNEEDLIYSLIDKMDQIVHNI